LGVVHSFLENQSICTAFAERYRDRTCDGVAVEVEQGYALDGTPPPATTVLSHGKVTLFRRFSWTNNQRPDICVPAADKFISRDHARFCLDALGKCTFVFVGANGLAKHPNAPTGHG
jgi:hypothetical protein